MQTGSSVTLSLVSAPVRRFPLAHTSYVAPLEQVLTGATGALGAHLLNQFLANPTVSSVYCLCRAETEKHARERVNTSLTLRGLGPLDERVGGARVICLPSSLDSRYLGLGEMQYQEIRDKASIIVDNAWAVNL